MNNIIDFFNHPFFIIVGSLATLSSIFAFIYFLAMVIKGVLPVWYRLGIGLSKRKIAIFSETNYESMKDLLVDSKIFPEKNIVKISKDSIRKADDYTLLLIHWESSKDKIEEILTYKKDKDALIIYAPLEEGRINQEMVKKINEHRNSIIVNMRGRLINDILTCMITTGFEMRRNQQ